MAIRPGNRPNWALKVKDPDSGIYTQVGVGWDIDNDLGGISLKLGYGVTLNARELSADGVLVILVPIPEKKRKDGQA